MQKNIATVNNVNSALILASCAIAYLVPFELLLFSYAVLGPAHYLTQIPWLHDRKYFIRSDFKYYPVLLYFFTVPVILFPKASHIFIYAVLIYALLITLQVKWPYKALVAFLMGGLGIMILHLEWFRPLMLLMPTLIHVYVFTFFFMAAGVIRNYEKTGLISLILLLLCGVQFFLVEQAVGNIFFPDYVGQNALLAQGITKSVFDLFGVQGGDDWTWTVARFAAFAYTYHYLNWFSKTGVIRWHEMTKMRAGLIVVLYLLSVGVYLYDYKMGFLILLYLSTLHVLLEFPLNITTFKTVSRFLSKRGSHARAH